MKYVASKGLALSQNLQATRQKHRSQQQESIDRTPCARNNLKAFFKTVSSFDGQVFYETLKLKEDLYEENQDLESEGNSGREEPIFFYIENSDHNDHNYALNSLRI